MVGYSQQALSTYVKLIRCAESVTARLHPHLAQAGVTPSQFGVLEALYHLGPMSMGAISAKVLKTNGNLTMVVNNLEKRGLARRQVNPEDRRSMTVSLTDSGRALIRTVFPKHVLEAARTFSILNPQELELLGALLKKLGTAPGGEPGKR